MRIWNSFAGRTLDAKNATQLDPAFVQHLMAEGRRLCAGRKSVEDRTKFYSVALYQEEITLKFYLIYSGGPGEKSVIGFGPFPR